MDRIRNARHFAPRLQRWLDELITDLRPAPPVAAASAASVTASATQLDLFAQEAASQPASQSQSPSLPQQPQQQPQPQSHSQSSLLRSAAPAPARLPAPDGPFFRPLPKLPAAVAPALPVAPLLADPSIPHIAPLPPRPRVAPPPPAPEQPPKRQLMVGQFVLEYTLRRSTRRSIGFMIDDDGLRVTAPKRISIGEIDNAIRTKQQWILSKLQERRERRAARLEKPPIEWIDGAQLPYLGADITLRLLVGGRNRSSYNPATRELSMVLVPGATETLLKERVRAWYQLEARTLFEQRLDLYAARLGVRYHSLTLSSASTRWGSCTIERKIRLNWKLIHFSLPLIDYVVAHELSHLLEMNHSARFWNTVGQIYPEYEEAKQLLRKRAQELPTLF